MKELLGKALRGPIRVYNERLIRSIYNKEIPATRLPACDTNFLLIPHVDDEVIGLGGWLLKHGRQATLCYSTDSGGSRSGTSYRNTSEIRNQEAEHLAETLQVREVHFLEIREDATDETWAAGAHRLAEQIRRVNPERIFTVSPYDNHPLHRKTTQMLQTIRDALPEGVRITFYEGSNLMPYAWINAFVPLDEETYLKKARLYDHFPSQLQTMDFDIYQRLNRGKGIIAEAYAAELFCDLSLPEFLRYMKHMEQIAPPGYRLGNHRSFYKIREELKLLSDIQK